jgi:tRNA pseudouridine55 synthase
MRRVLGTRKIGHAGTLDPAATGLLVLGVGRATRLLGYLSKSDKTYTAWIRLGVATSTDDADGDVTAVIDAGHLDEVRIGVAFEGQVGQIDQVPSAVSAVKIDGRRAYDRVRSGETVAIAPRRVRIDSLDVGPMVPRRVQHHGGEFSVIDLPVTVRCSAGTYIRAIARDAGAALGVGGHVTSLRRTAAGAFDIEQARELSVWEELGDRARAELMSMREAAVSSLPTISIDPVQADSVRHGRQIPWPVADDATRDEVALVTEDELMAIARRAGDRARYLAVFVS